MEFNVGKCQGMHLGRNNNNHKYTMNNLELTVITEEKDVGALMMQNLKPSSQCLKTANTAQLGLFQVGRGFYYRYRHVFLGLYKQCVRPHLEFAAQAWKCLEGVQRQAVKMVTGSRQQHK